MIVAAHALTETTKEANAYALNHIVPTTNDLGIVERWLLRMRATVLFITVLLCCVLFPGLFKYPVLFPVNSTVSGQFKILNKLFKIILMKMLNKSNCLFVSTDHNYSS